MAKQISARAASTAVNPLRGPFGRSPVMHRLLDELEQYAQAKGEQLIRSAGSKAIGALSGSVAGGLGDGKGAAVGEAVGEAIGGGGGVGKAVVGAVGALARGGKKGSGSRKATLIIHDIDIGRPVTTVYNQWTQYDSFSDFMKTVEEVDKKDDVESNWRVKVGPSRRSWQARVTEMIPDRRIMWTSEGAKGTTKGVVTFHPLCDDLTRVGVVMEYFPAGPVEKFGNMFKTAYRRTRWDLRNFRRFITERDEATGAWRGEIHDGEVTRDHEEPSEDDREQEERRDESRAEQEEPEEQARAEASDEAEAEPDADANAEEEAEPEPERRRARARSGSS